MKYAAIVGAGGGLGSELSKLYLESGWFVFGFDLAASARVSELSEAHPGRFQFDCLDITSDAMVGEAARQVAARTDRLDLLVNAAGILLFHNHPSGDPSPSAEDLAFTRRMAKAGEVVRVRVVDHIIIGEAPAFVSLRQRGAF